MRYTRNITWVLSIKQRKHPKITSFFPPKWTCMFYFKLLVYFLCRNIKNLFFKFSFFFFCMLKEVYLQWDAGHCRGVITNSGNNKNYPVSVSDWIFFYEIWNLLYTGQIILSINFFSSKNGQHINFQEISKVWDLYNV